MPIVLPFGTQGAQHEIKPVADSKSEIPNSIPRVGVAGGTGHPRVGDFAFPQERRSANRGTIDVWGEVLGFFSLVPLSWRSAPNHRPGFGHVVVLMGKEARDCGQGPWAQSTTFDWSAPESSVFTDRQRASL